MDRRDTRPGSDNRKGRVVQELRSEGKELVDEERLATMFMDLADYIGLDNNEDQARREAEYLAGKAMGILRG